MAISSISTNNDKLYDALKVRLGAENGKPNVSEQQAVLNVVNFVKSLIQTDGTFVLSTSHGQKASFGTKDFLQMVNDRVTNILGKGNTVAEQVQKELSKIEQAYLQDGAVSLLATIIKDPEMLHDINEILAGIDTSKLSEGDTKSSAHNHDQIQRLNIAFEAAMQEAKSGDKEEVLQILKKKISGDTNFTKQGLGMIKTELNRANALAAAQLAFKSGINLQSLLSSIVYSGSFEDSSIMASFSAGNFSGLSADSQAAVNLLIKKFAAMMKQAGADKAAKQKAAVEFTNQLSKLNNEQKAYAKHLLQTGEKLSKEINFDKIFNNLSTMLPGLFGSGIIGVMVSYLFGFSPTLGAVGSLVMSALAVTDPDAAGLKQKAPKFVST